MKFPALILTLSLATNGVLAGVYLFSRPDASLGPSSSNTRGTPGVEPQARPGDVPRRGDDGAGAFAASASAAQLQSFEALLRSGDGEELTKVLRAAGVSEDLIRALVREQVSAPFRSRIRAIEEAARGDRPWWQSGGRTELTPEQRAEVRQIQREMRGELERVLGPEEGRGDRAGVYAFLSGDKAEAARQVDSDYAEMSRELRDRMEDFRLPSDRDAFRLLEEERRADLAALLTPAELEDLEMRTSSVSARLRRELGTVVASEAEFREIYRLAAAVDAQYGRDSGGQDVSRGDRNAAEAALKQQIMDMLGPERTAVLARQRDPDYRTMQAATVRLNLPATATDTVMAARAQAAEQSQRISGDAALDAAAKRAALAAVASGVRAQLQSAMGKEGAEAFAQRAEWVRALERGSSFSLRPEGGVNVQRNRDGGG